ncbi:hypothetical protein Q8G48_28555, partial [Klebsiella pneumoniae]|uniref:hypothetical protein n=1 Tax=Klebsiella pneumoniae TaxID=573 RepID=UPI0030135993
MEVAKTTLAAVEEGYYADGEFYQLNEESTKKRMEGTKLYSGAPPISQIPKPTNPDGSAFKTVFRVVEEDSFVVAEQHV